MFPTTKSKVGIAKSLIPPAVVAAAAVAITILASRSPSPQTVEESGGAVEGRSEAVEEPLTLIDGSEPDPELDGELVANPIRLPSVGAALDGAEIPLYMPAWVLIAPDGSGGFRALIGYGPAPDGDYRVVWCDEVRGAEVTLEEANSMGEMFGWREGDTNGDGAVDLSDLNSVLANFDSVGD